MVIVEHRTAIPAPLSVPSGRVSPGPRAILRNVPRTARTAVDSSAVLARIPPFKKPTSFSLSEPAMEMTTAELATVLGIGTRQIQALEKRGILVKLGHGLWHLPTNVQAWGAHKAQSEVARVAKSPAEERLAAAKADLAEAKVVEKTEELIRQSEQATIDCCDEIMGSLKPDLYAIAARVTRDVSLRSAIRDEVDGVLSATVDRIEKRIKARELKGGKITREKRSANVG